MCGDLPHHSGRSSAWLERYVRDVEVAGSNPVAPTLLWKIAVVRRGKSGFNGRGVALPTASCLSPISRRRWRSSPALGSQTLLGSERERHNSSASRLENGPLPTKARSRQPNPAAPRGRGSSESACLPPPADPSDTSRCTAVQKAGRIKVWPISRAVFATCTHEIGFGFFDPLTRRGFHGEPCLSPRSHG